MVEENPFRILFFGSIKYSIGGLIAQAITLLSVPLFLMYLNSEQFGVQAIAVLNQQILMILSGYAITNATGKFYSESRVSGRQGYVIGTAIYGLLFFGILLEIIWQIFAVSISSLTLDVTPSSILITRLVGISFLANLFFNLALNIWQLDRNISSFIVSNILKNVFTVIFALPFIIFYSAGAVGVVLGMTIATIITGIYSFIWLVRKFEIKFEWALFKQILAYGVPFVPAAFAMMALNGFDRYILKIDNGLGAVGIYSVMFILAGGAAQLLVIPFKQIWVSQMWFMRNKPGEEEFHRRTFTYYISVQIFVFCGLILFGDIAIFLLTVGRMEYVSFALAAGILYLGFIFSGTYDITSAGIFFEGKTHLYTIAVFIAAGFTIALNLLLVPLFGIWGCAIAYCVSYFIFALLIYYFGKKYFNVSHDWARIKKIILTGIIICVLGLLVRQIGGLWGIVCAILVIINYPIILYLNSFFYPDELGYINVLLSKLHPTRKIPE